MTTSTLQLASIATLLHILVCVQGNLPFIHRDLDHNIFIGLPTRPLRFLLPEDSCEETGNARGRECEQPCTSFDVELDSNALSADGRANLRPPGESSRMKRQLGRRLNSPTSPLLNGKLALDPASTSWDLDLKVGLESMDPCKGDTKVQPGHVHTEVIPSVSSHDRYERYLYNVSLWCETIRPCPVFGGTAGASHNTINAKNAFKKGSSWSSGVVTTASLANGGVWISYTYDRAIIVGRISFTSSEQLNFNLEGSNDGITWKSLATQHEADGRFKVDHDKTWTSVAFQQYRLRIIASSWSKSGATHGTITIDDVQLCLLDDFGTYNDNHLVTSPPFIAFGRPFATSRWGRNWSERFAFYGPHVVWSSKYQYARNGRLNTPQHIGYTFPAPKTVRKIAFMGTYQQKYLQDHPRQFAFEGSDDKLVWTALLSTTIDDFPSTGHQVELEIPEDKIRPFKHFRLLVLKTGWSSKGLTGGYVQLRAFKMC